MGSAIVALWPDSHRVVCVLAMLICPFPVDMQDAKSPNPDIICEAAMTTFDKREEGFEKKFAHDEELRFKAEARRNKTLGLWAAEKLGLSGAAADAYAKEVVVADFDAPGDNDVFEKVRKDFEAKKVAVS